jgi:hypothetical protein
MRFPFVSRGAFDAQSQLVEHLLRDLAAEKKRSEHLLDTLLLMKMSGATVQRAAASKEHVLAHAAAEARKDRPVRSSFDQAIDENALAGADPFLRRHLLNWAEKELRKPGADEEEICDRLRSSAAWDAEDESDLEILGV